MFLQADEFCPGIDGTCYVSDQTLDLDNCWFMVAESDLDISSALVSVTAYNRAMLSKTNTFTVIK